MEITDKKIFFEPSLQSEIKNKFYYVNEDHTGRKRQFFENSGGSLRLKAAVEAKSTFEKIPDCPERIHDIAEMLKNVKEKGIQDIMEVIFGAKSGALVTELTASQVMFQITRTIMENAPGTNVVTTSIEHPSAYDSAKMYAQRTGKEFRVAMANPKTGGVDTEEILRHIDKDTCLLSVMSASNISGYIFDLEEIVLEARKINPDIYIISDAVQHVPHGVIDVEKLKLDGANFAPYKAFGIRGCGYGYISDRVAKMPHHKLLAKPENEWELGTFPHSNFASVTAVVDYVCWLGSRFSASNNRRELFVEGMNQIHLQEHSLLIHMMEGTDEVPGLRHIPGVQVFLDSADTVARDLISAIGIDGLDYTQAVKEYYKRGVTVFERVDTSLYSKRIVESLNLKGAIRVSPLHCHDTSDIDDFLRITAEIAKTFRRDQ
ncbi:aminotransferase class V-fold PLP-dependent enzyme [Alkaliphilus oremlandii]|uniref:Aminotransferase class V n=1 Tax=Alkaliphilus oremlandii (strain OhILAs) TaxID=350688 RepID=A8MJ93_ALKOO|nr:aminotransferase class V-fold PLP-dependent enzyme [Alkaliphilus oremlandii]ABW19875.1 aminotransferase class V [Alkaliphilus oremlandii OhILAs]